MNPSTRRIAFAVFLVVLATVIALVSSLPGPWNLLLILSGIAGAFFVGEVLFWRTRAEIPAAVDIPVTELLETPLAMTPVLEVPPTFQDEQDAEAAHGVEAEPAVEAPEQSGAAEVAETADSVAENPESLILRELAPLLEELKLALEAPNPLNVSLAEIQGGTDFVKENVVRSYEISDNLANSAKQAFDLSEKVQNGVKIVTDALNQSLHQTEILFEHSQRIAKILVLMSEVSDKIHILSINASIVSARAGILGRGFEVVAKEIRSLAKETETSLGEIEEVIGLLQSTISNVIRVVHEADKETEEEKSSLISVAGSLQGVILGVEIIRAVSSFAKDKSEENSAFIGKLIEQSNATSENPLKIRVADWSQRLQQFVNKE